MFLPTWVLLLLFLVGYTEPMEFTDDVIGSYRDKVRRMFYHAYNGYLDYAYPLDELKPLSCVGQDTWGSFSLSLVDALDTLLVMGNHTEFVRAVDLVLKSVRTDANVNVSVFETNIRVVGGLLAAHMMSGRVKEMELEAGWPCSGPLLRLAEQMASRLLPAFNTDTGMPYGTVNLRYGVHRDETPITCTAGVGTFIVEFGTLSRLVGDPQYERAALRALESLWNTRSPIGLVGNHINVQTGQWTATDSGIGAGVDSYFEYLVKGALLFQRPSLMMQFNEYASSINRHVRKDDWFLWVTMQKGTVTLPIFQSLEAFWPGLLTMVGDVEDASRIMLQYSQTIRQYGFPPEFYNIPSLEHHDKRPAYPLRPEMAESLMYLYRATEDPKFLDIGAQLIDAIEHSAKTKCGYATVNNVGEHSMEDRMESFFLAETTKYLYLLFDPKNFLHNDGTEARVVDTPNGKCIVEAGGYIYNTEAHPMDPSIVHCCSQQRKDEWETIRKWEGETDFISLLQNHGKEQEQRVDPSTLRDHLEDQEHISGESRYVEKQYGTDELEYEVDENILMKKEEEGQREEPKKGEEAGREENEKELDVDEELDLLAKSVTENGRSERRREGERPGTGAGEDARREAGTSSDTISEAANQDEATPPSTAQPTGMTSWTTREQGEGDSSAEKGETEEEKRERKKEEMMQREQVVGKVRVLIREARLMDDEKRERGEKSSLADNLLANLIKMHQEHADLLLRAKELDDMDAREMKRILEKRREVERMGVVEAECQSCCYPMEFIGDSVGLRMMLNHIHWRYIYPGRKIQFDYGPLCRPGDEPRIEDSYKNVPPSSTTSHSLLPGDTPSSLFHLSPSPNSFSFSDISHLGFSLLSSPPLSYQQKFAGLGQVTLKRNSTWYYKV